jgi:DNA-binding response OmpR family regulator
MINIKFRQQTLTVTVNNTRQVKLQRVLFYLLKLLYNSKGRLITPEHVATKLGLKGDPKAVVRTHKARLIAAIPELNPYIVKIWKSGYRFVDWDKVGRKEKV